MGEVAHALRDALLWEMTPARWELLAGILAEIAEAAESGDPDALAAARAGLELVGPVRITRIGSTPRQPPPPPVRERINHLIYRLSGGTVRGDGNAEAAGT